MTRFDAPAPAVVGFDVEETGLTAEGPGAVFPSIEAAAVDALTYAYLSAKAEHTTERARGGSIYATRGGYSYEKIHVAGRIVPHRISYTLKPGDAARFVIYPPDSDRRVNWRNERPSTVDRRGVTFKDPLHRPLYVLHPSLMIREYRGENHELTAVADLRHPALGLLLAGGARTRGRDVFLDHCAVCHGEQADGRGVQAKSLSRKPADFRDPSWEPCTNPGRSAPTTPERTHRIVREGVSGTPMPAWKAALGERETWDLVAYVMDV